MFSFKSLASLLALTSVALAHGSVKEVIVGGKSFPGSTYGGGQSRSPMRKLGNMGEPITDPNSPSLPCGVGAARAPISAPAAPGSKIQFFWQAEGGSGNWFHKDGPIVTYITKCPGDCKDFTPTASTNWFKISQQGQKNPAVTGGWFQEDLLKGSPSTVTLPSNLGSGNYLLRHEIITLQRATMVNGAEYYPNCLQLSVSGGSSGFSGSPAVHFPGAYKSGDPGILVDIYTPSNKKYVIPGGAIASLGGGSGGSNPPAAPAAPSQPPANAGAKPPSTPKPPVNNTCKRKRAAKERRMVKKALENHTKKRRLPASY